jgi:very-short-patch-repair endonuclease
MLYKNYPDNEKKKIIEKLYIDKGLSFKDIASQLQTYANKIRRDAIRFNIAIRDKSEAQKNALSTGKHKHPTKGQERPDNVKQKIGHSVMNTWENLPVKEKKARQKKAQELWESLDDNEKQSRLLAANKAVRQSSKLGSKLENFLLHELTRKGYKPEFHKEQVLANTRLQIDLYLPTMSIAIEVDGPSHFLPVWGDEALKRNQKYDKKKSGLIIGKGLKLIRIKQTHDFSKSRASQVFDKLINVLHNHTTEFASSQIVEIED